MCWNLKTLQDLTNDPRNTLLRLLGPIDSQDSLYSIPYIKVFPKDSYLKV